MGIVAAAAGRELLQLARAGGADSIAVVGTGKNVGKTVVVRAVCEALARERAAYGLTSIGRDGEAVDASDALAKPRLFLYPGALLATARDVLPATPAVEIADLSGLQTAAGPVVYARVRRPGFYEVAGAPTASGIAESVAHLQELGAEFVVLDGAVDRVAALAGGTHAVVVATGAANVLTPAQAVAELRGLVERLRIARVTDAEPYVLVPGALTATDVARYIAQKESRQIVVQDPTKVTLRGKVLLSARERLDIRCLRPVQVIAVTVASVGADRYFEPATLLREAAAATGLPVFDVYAAKKAAA